VFWPSQGSDEESQYDEAEAMEEDKLISNNENEKVRAGSHFIGQGLHSRQATIAQSKKLATPNDRIRNKSKKRPRGSCRLSARKWTKQRCAALHCIFGTSNNGPVDC